MYKYRENIGKCWEKWCQVKKCVKKGEMQKKEEKMGKVEKINIMEKNCQNNQK